MQHRRHDPVARTSFRHPTRAMILIPWLLALGCDAEPDAIDGDEASFRTAIEASVCEQADIPAAQAIDVDAAIDGDAAIDVDVDIDPEIDPISIIPETCDDRLDDCLDRGGTPSPPNMSLVCSFTTKAKAAPGPWTGMCVHGDSGWSVICTHPCEVTQDAPILVPGDPGHGATPPRCLAGLPYIRGCESVRPPTPPTITTGHLSLGQRYPPNPRANPPAACVADAANAAQLCPVAHPDVDKYCQTSWQGLTVTQEFTGATGVCCMLP